MDEIDEVGVIVYKILFYPKISDEIKDFIKNNYFGEDTESEMISKQLTWHYKLDVLETMVRKSNLHPKEILDFVYFREKCRKLDIDYIEF